MTDVKSPEPYFTTSSSQEIFMSYGLLNRIARIVGNVESVGLLLVDVNIQGVVLCIVLSTYDAKGKLVEEVDVESIMMPPDETVSLIVWVTEHLTSFFLKNLRMGETMINQFQAMAAQSLGLSPSGSPS